MAATAAEATFGVVLKKGTTDIGGAYSDWGLEVLDITAPGWTREAIDATHHASPNGWGETILSGVQRQKPFTVEVSWIPEDTGTIKTELETTAMVYWKIEFPDASSSSVIFKAGITDFSPGAMPVDGKFMATIEFTPTGEPTWA